METVQAVLEWYYKRIPEDKDIPYWSGCNYNINQRNNEQEPAGTAQSMHDCEGCDRLSTCTVKQQTPVWEWSEEKEKQLRVDWKTMMQKEGE